MVELGISTFGETTPLEKTGKSVSHAERIRNLVEEIELADQVGLDVYAIGEHHREDFAVSAPEVVLAAGAVKTKQIRLSSAVTVLSSIDPVRVYQQYATIDALSNGRSEIMVGRGSFTESFPLFGYDLNDYEDLFDEKLEMLLAIKEDPYLNWQGQHTQSVENRPVYPRAVQEDFPIKIATGGSPESTQKIAALGLPIVYAIIGGNPRYFKSLIDMYRKIGRLKGHDESKMTVGAHSWGWIAEDREKAERDYFYPTKQLVDAISKDRPFWQELTYEAYQKNIAEDGAMFVGDPDTVANKMIRVIEDLGLDSFMLHIPVGSMPHEDTLKAIRLYGEEVAPKVRAYFSAKGQ
ncbi:LLM class flavin-dependent oxidoreductase [Streptococcus acidominimus]|uniref:Luciferase n=1 Tax=Streptococcus acidominimus TaxID=1326 RepID=A0A1Q8EFE7_STRAI|nr:LLM class flavin-dependent oxidoreductase [Streptococcus acidominimus]OLF50511.1 luciferase [Streptococcus acidominimus]SUN05646.1 oxidoreductase [Streptococcus acidominimus]